METPNRIYAKYSETELTYGFDIDKYPSEGAVEYVRKDIVEELKKRADAMYSSAQYLTTDASHLRKAMGEYWHFINFKFNSKE